MLREMQCPRCGEWFDAVEWEEGSCPHCGLEYSWDNCPDYDEDDNFMQDFAVPDWEDF